MQTNDTLIPMLVVEDENALQEAITTKLSHKGFHPYGVRSVDDALKTLADNPEIQAIWLDHYLFGKKDGLDLVEQLKSGSSSYKELPIFVVSNTASADKVQKYLHLGVNEYYVKATNRLDEIIKDIRELLEKKGQS